MSNRNDITTEASQQFRELLKSKRREMKKGNRKRFKEPKKPSLNRMLYPFSQERQYTRWLAGLMDIYSDIALPTLNNRIGIWTDTGRGDAIRSDDFQTEFQQLINELRETQNQMFTEGEAGVRDDKGRLYSYATIFLFLNMLGNDTADYNDTQMQKFFRAAVGQGYNPAEPWLNGAIESWSAANFELIKSLSDEYIKKLNTIVREGVLDGQTKEAIMKSIRGMDKNMTRYRVRLLARDQIGKLNGRLTKARMQQAGIDMYRWLTAMDERVRARHKKLSNLICRWDNDAVYADSVSDAKAGNWKSRSSDMFIGTPGQDIQCRCTAVPVMDDIIDEIDDELEQEFNMQGR